MIYEMFSENIVRNLESEPDQLSFNGTQDVKKFTPHTVHTRSKLCVGCNINIKVRRAGDELSSQMVWDFSVKGPQVIMMSNVMP